METSDSEHFESADEDFQSDDENTKTVVSDTKSNPIEEIKNIKITETPLVSLENNNENVDTTKTDNLDKDKDHNLNPSEPAITTQKKLDNVENKVTVTSEDDKSGDSGKNSDVPPKSAPEDNLWDDSEIDWGKEMEDLKSDEKPAPEEDMWENDDWEPIQQLPEEKPLPDATWGSWGTWGVSTLLSSASTITQGISNVLETGMGVPEPEELAKINRAEKEKLKEKYPEIEDKSTGFGLGNLVMGVSHLTKLVESTGTKVISGGLDTLETIGKKTMEVLQEGDPGLKRKRAFLKIDQDKPVLSQLLREAKEKAEDENTMLERKHFAKRAKNYETLFDDHQGLVHLEALEMLSRQCDIKLQTLLESYTDDSLTDMQETMDQVKELCELPDEDDDDQTNWSEIVDKLEAAVTEINVPISYKKLIDTWEETETWLNHLKLDVCDERELHQQAVETLAQLTALAVEQFHKTGELLLVKEHRSTADEADSLVQLTTSLTALIGIVAAKFSDKLNTKSASCKNKEEINSLITNVFFEAANSSSYIQDAFQLLVPVLQVGAV